MVARADWKARVEQQGLLWHTDDDGRETWNEQAAYLLSPAEVQRLCQAASELAEMYHEAAEHVVKKNLWPLIGLQNHESELIASSWKRREWSLHGRFDFLFDVQGCPRLLEYNAETALSLIETAVIQKRWLGEVMPKHGQFNQLEESLVQAWRESGFKHVHCAWRPRHAEVEGTVSYMAQLMRRVGIQATMMAMHRMGWNSRDGSLWTRMGDRLRTVSNCIRGSGCCASRSRSEWRLRVVHSLNHPGACCWGAKESYACWLNCLATTRLSSPVEPRPTSLVRIL